MTIEQEVWKIWRQTMKKHKTLGITRWCSAHVNFSIDKVRDLTNILGKNCELTLGIQ